jgi:LicD family
MILRALGWICLILYTLLPPSLADAEFVDVRTHLVKDRSGKKGDPKDKYFHESTFHPHYDGRFAAKRIDNNEKLSHLTALMKTFLATMNDIGAETWIMHGTLLGWWWNQRILPWDSDLDVQVDEQTITFLAKYYNMTEYHYDIPEVNGGRTYLLEINPHYTIPGIEDKLNVIDARWIDTDTGLFIDISTVRANHTARALGVQGALMCKDRHHYLVPSNPSSFPFLSMLTCLGTRHLPAPHVYLRRNARENPLRLLLAFGGRIWPKSSHGHAIRAAPLEREHASLGAAAVSRDLHLSRPGILW